jgi:hypothetical protein
MIHVRHKTYGSWWPGVVIETGKKRRVLLTYDYYWFNQNNNRINRKKWHYSFRMVLFIVKRKPLWRFYHYFLGFLLGLYTLRLSIYRNNIYGREFFMGLVLIPLLLIRRVNFKNRCTIPGYVIQSKFIDTLPLLIVYDWINPFIFMPFVIKHIIIF